MNFDEWKSKNEYSRKYTHFDKRTSIKRIEKYILNKENIAKHAFYPFITYDIVFKKFSKKGIKKKTREICYSAHKDKYIYSYYSFQLNNLYNERVAVQGTNNVAIAYRDNLKKSNIHFAYEAIKFIREMGTAYIIVGDFTDFFGSLNHDYLKKQLCRLYNCDRLPSDVYNVYKNITKFSTIKLEDILKYFKYANNQKNIELLNKKDVLFTSKEFRAFKSEYFKKNDKNPKKGVCGIPQGSSISAVLSNIYMLETDKVLNDLVKQLGGFYLRYSDDIIIILPNKGDQHFKYEFNQVTAILDKVDGLQLQKEKTQAYFFENEKISGINEVVDISEDNSKQNYIDYLGFIFDGKYIAVRPKSITKYNYRLRRKCRNILKAKGKTKNGHTITWEQVYEKYSRKGSRVDLENKKRGNYISYINRARKIMGDDEKIHLGTSKHMLKIKRWRDELNQGS